MEGRDDFDSITNHEMTHYTLKQTMDDGNIILEKQFDQDARTFVQQH